MKQREDDEEDPGSHVYYKVDRVFNTAQTEGCDLRDIQTHLDRVSRKFDHQDESMSEAERVANVCDAMTNPPGYREAPRIIPNYSPMTDTVTMLPLDQVDSVAAFARIRLHEYAHATGHPSRLGRFDPLSFMIGEPGSEARRLCERAAEEMFVETATVLMAARLELATESFIENSAAHIAGWAKMLESGDGRGDFAAAASEAQKITDYILGPIDGLQIESSP